MSDALPSSRPVTGEAAPAEPVLIDAGYLAQEGEQIYYICHGPVQGCRASVLLAGPFAFERSATYAHWHKWALHLARAGFRVMRFDYRGHAESTGRFEAFGPREWSEDIRRCAAWLREQDPGARLFLHGLRLGGLLADRVFRQGVGDGLLLWSPPTSARDMLYALLRLRLVADFALPVDERRSREDLVADLESGRTVEVDCFPFERKLWEDAAAFARPATEEGALAGEGGRPRPWKTMHLHTLPSNPGLAFDPMTWTRVQFRNPDFTDLFAQSRDWLLRIAKNSACARSSDTI